MKVQLNLRVFSEDLVEFRKIGNQSGYKTAILFRKMVKAYKAEREVHGAVDQGQEGHDAPREEV